MIFNSPKVSLALGLLLNIGATTYFTVEEINRV